MPKAKKRRRSILAPILALLLVLALAGTLLFSAFRDKIDTGNTRSASQSTSNITPGNTA